MQLNNVILKTILIILFSFNANSKLPLLATKQELSNINFISSDGKLTYYQRRSGTLLRSTNYSVDEVIQGEIATQYNLTVSSYKKYIAVEQSENMFHTFEPRSAKKIFYLKYGEKEAKFVGHGINTRLHLGDEWLSYYKPRKREIHFLNLFSSVRSFKIKIHAKRNPYFVPEVLMTDSSIVVYTDQNELGETGIATLDRKNQITKVIYKEKDYRYNVELCYKNGIVYLGKFPFPSYDLLSLIGTIDIKGGNFSKIYANQFPDTGSMICDFDKNNIYFIRNVEQNHNIARLHLPSRKAYQLSKLNDVTSILTLDRKLLVGSKGRYYVAVGEANISDKDRLDSK